MQAQSSLRHISDMIPAVLHDRAFFDRLLCEFSFTVPEMFRDPPFFRALRQQIVPVLRTYPFVTIWDAGCSTGEEVYSLAIILKEEKLYDRTRIYATDPNRRALLHARAGIYPAARVKSYARRYREAAGTGSFLDYFHIEHGCAQIDSALKDNILFTYHDLVTDGMLGEMHLIICRNVLLYLDQQLQERVLDLFLDSLCHRGFLCLDSAESLDRSLLHRRFEPRRGRERIYRKAMT